MNNINDINKLTLEYLINPAHYNKYYKNNKEIDEELINDKIFYRKRIINCIKQMLKGNFADKVLEDNFNIYVKTIIIHLKEIDTKDILQASYEDFSNNLIEKDNLNIKEMIPENNLQNSNILLYKEINHKNTIDKFVKHKIDQKELYNLPEKRNINLRDPKLKKKGLAKKEKYIDILNENEKD